jgi:uncharacterized protein (DUF488 family)
VAYFIQLLKKQDINYVIDVRSTPYSKYAQDYNRDNISRKLPMEHINYAYMGNYFGARQENMELYTPEGYLDFDKTVKSENFIKGMKNVMKGMEENRIAMMCMEKKPIDCHRAIMVANAFYRAGCQVKHILDDGSIQTHEQLNEELLDMYFPDRNQMSFFENRTEQEYLQDAYRLRNKEIGYYIAERQVVV